MRIYSQIYIYNDVIKGKIFSTVMAFYLSVLLAVAIRVWQSSSETN